jgi:ribose/xylose/arabinose/galactoside ABC-type transport system permease subunit
VSKTIIKGGVLALLNNEQLKENNGSNFFKNVRSSLDAVGVLGIILIGLFIAVSFASDKFFTINNLANLARQTSIVGIIAVGMTFVIISAGIDLSVGSVLALGGIVASMMMRDGFPIYFSIIVASSVGIIVGIINGIIINDLKVTPFIATLGTMTIIRAFVMLITNANYISPIPRGFVRFVADSILYIPILFLIWIFIVIIAFIISKYTRLGRNIFAIGSSIETARLSGINIRTNTYIVYIICAVLSSFAGVLTAGRLATGIPTAGMGYELQVIAAVVVGGGSLFGGEGTIIGTLLGALLIATIGNGGNLLGVNPQILKIIIGALIIISVYIDQLSKKGK